MASSVAPAGGELRGVLVELVLDDSPAAGVGVSPPAAESVVELVADLPPGSLADVTARRCLVCGQIGCLHTEADVVAFAAALDAEAQRAEWLAAGRLLAHELDRALALISELSESDS